MIQRPLLENKIKKALSRGRVVSLLGPRQSGKTTLARSFLSTDSPNYFDLEIPAHRTRLEEPMSALSRLKGLVVIDEIQTQPGLFPILRVLADRTPLPAKFLILGSASPDFRGKSSESLTGRQETIEVSGFSLQEVGPEHISQHWLRGGFPPSYLSVNDEDSAAWRQNYIQSLLEKDLPHWGIGTSPENLRRFWTMLAHYHGQVWNASEPARSLGVSHTTIRKYLDLLESLFMVRQLQPYYANIKKRQVKNTKIYLRDCGLLHSLFGLETETELMSHPKCGASWEGYALEETLRAYRPRESYFWATHSGAELDLLMRKGTALWGVEFKRNDAPRMTPSLRSARQDLNPDRLVVVYPGDQRYALEDGVEVVPLVEWLAESGTIQRNHINE